MSCSLDSSDAADFEALHHLVFGRATNPTNDRPNKFVQKLYNLPLPSEQEMKDAFMTQTRLKLRHGAKGWKIVVNSPDQESDGKMIAAAIWYPPGVKFQMPSSMEMKDLTAEEQTAFKPVNLIEWNSFFGGLQDKCNEIHGDGDFW